MGTPAPKWSTPTNWYALGSLPAQDLLLVVTSEENVGLCPGTGTASAGEYKSRRSSRACEPVIALRDPVEPRVGLRPLRRDARAAGGRVPGVVMELKVQDRGETVEEAFERVLAQLRARDHAAALRARGPSPIHEMAIVSAGKRAHVHMGGEHGDAVIE